MFESLMKLIIATTFIILISVLNGNDCKKGFGPGSQEYGYVEVRKGAHMFYWLYYVNSVSYHSAPSHPLVIWLQGGPGASSTGYGNFEEFGTLDTKLNKREAAWTKHVNVLYIDNPVGTGFSYVTNDTLYVTNNRQISEDLVKFTKAFYKKFKKFSKTPLYIFCESYGGKMAAQFAYDLYKEIHRKKLKINFKGVALGDSWISPIDSCITWAPYLLNIGIVDTNGYKKIDKVAQELKELVENEKWNEATDKWGHLENVVMAVTYHVSFYNILHGDENDDESNDIMATSSKENYMHVGYKWGLMNHLRNDGGSLSTVMGKVKEALKSVIPTSVKWSEQSDNVFDNLREDFMKPVINYVEKLLNETKLEVIVYSGQLDLIVDTPGTVNWVDRLRWPEGDNWRNSTRQQLKLNVNGTAEGFVKSHGRFHFYWINRAGHMVPADNPNGSLEMLRQITHYKV